MNFNLYINDIGITLNLIKLFFLNIFTYYTSLKFSNIKKSSFIYNACILLLNFTSCLISIYLYYHFSYISNFILLFSFSFLTLFCLTHFCFTYSLYVTTISICINSIIRLFSIILCYLVSMLFNMQGNNFFVLLVMLLIHSIVLFKLLNTNRLKYGFSLSNSKFNNEFLDIIILNLSIIVIFLFIFIPRINYYFMASVLTALTFLSVIMAITIYKSFSLYYKHNLLVKELNDTKLELEKKDKEIERLEKENLEFSKTSHSIAHKQRVLEYKLNQLQLNTEFANELDLSDKLKEISDTYSSNVTNLTLPKTGIQNIDDILEYMQSECTKNNINFELQLNGDIFSMVTTVINKEKLEILLADHIKNAIIAINSSENINKSILVRLGLINDIYSIYFYDSGIEFDENVLSSLGKEQITTHKDIGGTGCGFLNTFDTLKEFNASLEINEISAPCKDNYTKSIVIKFDGKNDFEINSYKKQE